MARLCRRERVFILAGGLGTRLAGVVSDRPKVLALVDDRPFLGILIDLLLARGIRRIVLLLGHRAEQVLDFVQAGRSSWPAGLEIEASTEPSPLGTGGALKLASRFCDERFLLCNGDTYLDLDLDALLRAHENARALVTLAAATVDNADRYGRLDLSAQGSLAGFCEKDGGARPGLINAGVYVMEPAVLHRIVAPSSLERQVLPGLLAAGEPIGVSPQGGAFFDIGTPASYHDFVAFYRARRLSSAGVPPVIS
ncbi:MAG: sugar phosphate nucleotidyltransferase [Polyangia bacterium]